MSKLKIKIYAERNTGSRYLSWLIQHNLAAELLRGDEPRLILKFFRGNNAVKDIYFKMTFRRHLGWKHRMAPTAEELKAIDVSKVFFLTVTKNPYSWLLSLYRRPYHQERRWDSFDSFLLSPWKTLGRENHVDPFQNPIVMWNEKNRAYLDLDSFAPWHNVRYEDLVEDPEAVINDIATKSSLLRKQAFFENLMESTKPDPGKVFEYYQWYYLGEQWKDELDPNSLSIINTYLDHELATRLGYEILGNEGSEFNQVE